jgi:hypothetical protein
MKRGEFESPQVQYPLEGGFHWRNCWFFKRMSGGHVRITHAEVGSEVVQILIPPNEWASIVASVSAEGETSERYYEAAKFHGGMMPVDNDSTEAKIREREHPKWCANPNPHHDGDCVSER